MGSAGFYSRAGVRGDGAKDGVMGIEGTGLYAREQRASSRRRVLTPLER